MSLKALNSSGTWKDVPNPPYVKLRSASSSYWDKCTQAYALTNDYEWKPIFDGARIIDDELVLYYDFSVDRSLALGFYLMDYSFGGSVIDPKGLKAISSDGDSRTWFGNVQYFGAMTETIDFTKYVDNVRLRMVKTSNDASDWAAIQYSMGNNVEFGTRFDEHFSEPFDHYGVNIIHNDQAGSAQNAGNVRLYLSAYPKGKNQWDPQGKLSYPCWQLVGANTHVSETSGPITNHHTGDAKIQTTGLPTRFISEGGPAEQYTKANARVRSVAPVVNVAATDGIITTTITTTAGSVVEIGRIFSTDKLFVVANTFFGAWPYNVLQWQPGNQVQIFVLRNGRYVLETIASVTHQQKANVFTSVFSETDYMCLGNAPQGRILCLCINNKMDF